MKAALQRINSAHITLDGDLVASSNQGLLAFVGIEDGDTEEDVDSMVQRILQTVLWPEKNEPQREWKRSLQQTEGDILCIPQFILHDQHKHVSALDSPGIANFARAQDQYQLFMQKLSNTYRPERVKNDFFEAILAVPLSKDTPLGISYESIDSAVMIKIVTQVANEKMKPKVERKSYEMDFPASLQK